jgi:hypothetical protein
VHKSFVLNHENSLMQVISCYSHSNWLQREGLVYLTNTIDNLYKRRKIRNSNFILVIKCTYNFPLTYFFNKNANLHVNIKIVPPFFSSHMKH